MMSLEHSIYEAFGITGKQYPFQHTALPSSYIIDKKVVGLGYVKTLIGPIKENWYVTISSFIAQEGYIFHKYLYLFHDKEKNQLNRCHSQHIDQKDIEKGGGSNTWFTLAEIMATLIDHGENFDEKNCEACRGESKHQTHYIQLI